MRGSIYYFLLGLKLEGHTTFHPVKWEWYMFFSQSLWSICTRGGSEGLKWRQFNKQCHWPCSQCCIQTNNCASAGAYVTHSYARESSWESLCVFGQGEWPSRLNWIAHSQGSLLSPQEQETWFSLALLPGRIHPCPPWPPSFRSKPHTVGNPVSFTKQVICDCSGVPTKRHLLPRDYSVPLRF